MRYITIKVNGKKRNIGTIVGDTYTKKVNKKRHLFKKMNAWGVDSKLLNTILLPENIKIVYETKPARYTTTPKTVKEKGEYLHFKPHRSQVFLNINEWEKTI